MSHSKPVLAQSKTDSLKSELTNATSSTELTDLYIEIANGYYYGNQDSAMRYAGLYLQESLKTDSIMWIAYGYYYIADLFYYSNLDSSLFYIEKYLDVSQEMKDTAWIADAYSFLGYIYEKNGKLDLALDYFQKALDYYQICDRKSEIAASYNNIGYIISFGADQAKGLEYFIKALKLAETIPDTALLSDASCNIAYYYDRIEDYTSAIYYYEKALAFDQSLDNIASKTQSLTSLAEMRIFLEDFEAAEALLTDAKNYLPQLDNAYDSAKIYSSILDCYLELEEVDSSLLYMDRLETILYKNGFSVLDAYFSRQKGLYHFLINDLMSCISFLDMSISKFSVINIVEPFAEIYAKKAEAYARLSLFEEAYLARQRSIALEDSMKYGVVGNLLSKLEQERLYQLGLKNNRLEMEVAKQKFELSNIKTKSNLKLAIITILLLILLVGIIIYFFFNLRKKNAILKEKNSLINNHKSELEKIVEELRTSKDELKELNATKDKFFSIIAHDLKNPLSAIIGLSELYLQDRNNLHSRDILPIMENMNATASAGFSLLENLLEWARSQTGQMIPKPEGIQMDTSIQSLITDINSIAEAKNIKLEYNCESFPVAYADRNMISTVLRNLIHNALKFSYSNSVVTIHCIQDGNRVITSVEDHGIGLSDQELAKLFSIDANISKRGTQNEQGSGLGLILCKEFVQKNNGEIWAEGQEQKGCKFSFSLPVYEQD